MLLEHSVVTNRSPECQTGAQENPCRISCPPDSLSCQLRKQDLLPSIPFLCRSNHRLQLLSEPGTLAISSLIINGETNVPIRTIFAEMEKFTQLTVDFVTMRPTLFITASDLLLGPANRVPRIVVQHSGIRSAHLFSSSSQFCQYLRYFPSSEAGPCTRKCASAS
jgi:hypothetical protein